jgi:hypothetical protein
MDSEVTLSSTKSANGTNFVTHPGLKVPITFQGEKLCRLVVVNKAGQAHYTEEGLPILQTPALRTVITIQDTQRLSKLRLPQEQVTQRGAAGSFAFLTPRNPIQAGAGSRVFAS